MNDDFLKLTETVYKLLEFFPESDPLKNRAKDKALSIMEHLSLISETSGWASFSKEKTKAHVLEDIDILLGYLWIAKSQGWLNSVNCLIIANEYEKIRKNLTPIVELPSVQTEQPSAPVLKESEAIEEGASEFLYNAKSQLSDRQTIIINYLSNNGRAQVMDLQKVLPSITKRTIRRDLDELLASGKIVRMGEFNQVFYRISGVGHPSIYRTN